MGEGKPGGIGCRGRVRDSGQGHGPSSGREGRNPRGGPLIRVLLNADQMVVGKTVGLGMVLRFHPGASVSPVHVEDGDESAQGGE